MSQFCCYSKYYQMTVLFMHTCQICDYYEQIYQCYCKHCTIAQAVSCWLNTVEAWVKNIQKKKLRVK
jgi:hypothetical protein